MTWIIVPVGAQIVYCKGQSGVCVCPVCLAQELRTLGGLETNAELPSGPAGCLKEHVPSI